MSDIPDAAKLALSRRVKKQQEFKESKKLEVVMLKEGEWATIKPLWSQHYNNEAKKSYNARQPYIDQYGACIILLMSKPFEPKKAKNDIYNESFEYLLMCDDVKDYKKYIRLFDNKNNLFESWYYRINPETNKRKAYTRIAWVRGELTTKYRDLGDETTWGVYENTYCKQKGVSSVSELTIGTYERLFQLNLWEILEIQDPGVD